VEFIESLQLVNNKKTCIQELKQKRDVTVIIIIIITIIFSMKHKYTNI